ncbi:UDP-4-amino-4,6-dideoxy-N-acetyl-beta-L-altrosamine transaminase [Raineya orbicola]|uniref:PseC: UDP-4-keto-6-deoxy-N-acetylglucosamine 4-aminotransferase n=1 Tax=Raineya orbicola TaxID=2016530 RepID=A0A2N3IC11_9BACT|nr:UDP-4-amino-4,6-dideoxy-N-acetyl-beta-L-altrosamine transaminase [Raineya orbicola]PKQ67837.1 PseC: UDP-4-keto-6-deoxy-N-acetylglucosamine 4-aminotransferase [Raineya orbicola]
MKPIPYGKQEITSADIESVINTLQSDFWTQGPKIAEFEQKFAEYVGAKYAVAVANGTAALHLSALALGVKEGVNVITSPLTFVASANCIKYAGGNVFFADIDEKTLLLDLKKVEKLILSKPKGFFQGIIPVDFAGKAVDLERLKLLAQKYNLWILEDACHAPGGYFVDSKGEKQFCGNGNFADLAIFSFHPVKHIACGEGGMITTNRQDLYEKLLLLRTHGITRNPELLQENHGGWYYEMQTLGYNYRLTDLQCALGISQLQRAKENLAKRHQIALRYQQAFESLSEVKILPYDKGNAYHLYIIQTEKRKELYDYLKAHQIFCQVHYIPVHLQPFYKNLGYKKGDFPMVENYYEKCLSLPMYPTLTENEQSFVIEKIKAFFA